MYKEFELPSGEHVTVYDNGTVAVEEESIVLHWLTDIATLIYMVQEYQNNFPIRIRAMTGDWRGLYGTNATD